MFPFNIRRAAPGSTRIILRSLAICFLLWAQNAGTRNYPYQHSAWVAALCVPAPLHPGPGFFWPFWEADGSQRECWERWRRGGGGPGASRTCSGKRWLSPAGPPRSWKATRLVGQSLIGKQQRFVSTAIYVSSA